MSLSTIAGVFSGIGLSSFGGGLVSWMHREAVERRRWINDQEFLSGLALCQVMPGANMANLALYLGIHLRGTRGALAAILGLLTLPTAVVLVLGVIYARFDQVHALHFVLDGVATAAVGLNIAAGVKAARRSRNTVGRAVAAAIFLAVGVLHWPMLPVVLCLAPLSIALAWMRRHG